ncbi:MAG: hypothetical protein GF350_05405 [Chitinivibrionales bacterium]|nr:hypothetical protein [Chitinivibrionales bacterium]
MIVSREPVIKFIKKLGSRVFTTRDIAAISGKSVSTVVQGLKHLQQQGVVVKLYRGIWAERGKEPISPLSLLPSLPGGHRTYVSFTTALHIHGMIEQIPRDITCATLAHSRLIRSAVAVFSLHTISPDFFFGFDWYKQTGEFLIASPEKAILDCFYCAGRKNRNFGYLPELSIPDKFDINKARSWTERIHDSRLRKHVQNRFDGLILATRQPHRPD